MSTLPKNVIGITGNIACGKSAIINYLCLNGYSVIDSDKIVHDLYNDDSVFKESLVKTLGKEIIIDNIISKEMISKLVFSNEALLHKLNNLIHPIVKKELYKLISLQEGIVFVDIPLLYEAKFEDVVDVVILVYCEESIQRNRLMKRNNLSYNEAQLRMNKFINQAIKIEKANYVIDNTYSLDNTFKQVDCLLNDIKKEGI